MEDPLCRCPDNYYEINGQSECLQCNDNCKVCVNSADNCLSCAQGFIEAPECIVPPPPNVKSAKVIKIPVGSA